MEDTSSDPADPRGLGHTIPRWVKVSSIIALIVILAVGVMVLAGGGGHGPGRHSSSVDGGQSPKSTATESGSSSGHMPPAGGHTP